MSVYQTARRVARAIKKLRRGGGSSLARTLVSTKSTCQILNSAYNALPKKSHSLLFEELGAIFRDRADPPDIDHCWSTSFAGKTIIVPLRSGEMWLNWATALS